MKKKTLFLCRKETQKRGIHLVDLKCDPDFIDKVPTVRQAVENLHPIVKVAYQRDYTQSRTLGYYETLSEMAKTFSLRTWRDSSWETRISKVPELVYWNEEQRSELEKDFIKIFS